MGKRPDGLVDISELDQSKVLLDDLLSEEIRQDPVPHMARWRDHGPFYAIVSGLPSAVFMDTGSIREIYRDWQRFSSVKPDFPELSTLDIFNGQMVLTYCDPPDHNRLRRLVQPAFTPKNIDRLAAKVAQTAEEALSMAVGSGCADAVAEICQPIATTTVLGHLLGIPESGHRVFEDFSASWEILAQNPPGAPKPAAFLDAWEAASDYCFWLLRNVEQIPSGGLVEALVRGYEVDESVSESELLSLLMTLLTGGLGTIAALCALSFIMLGQHRDQWELIINDRSLVPGAVEEVLRAAPPGFLDFRYASADTEVNGLRLWRNMPVCISQAAPGFDPALFPDPTRFDIRRTIKHQFYFGEGPHRCIGAPLARLCARSLLATLARYYPQWTLVGSEGPFEFHGMPGERAARFVPVCLS